MEEKSAERLAMEEEASELGIQGNIPGFKDSTLARKIEEAKGETPTEEEKPSADLVCVGVNACAGRFGIAGLAFEPGADILLSKSVLSNRNVDARLTYAKKLGMIK